MNKFNDWEMTKEEEQLNMEQLSKFEQQMVHSLMLMGMTWQQAFNDVICNVNKDIRLLLA